MKGLELAREYYRAMGEPMLQAQFPALLPRLTIGLAGDGSECLGFDDEISRDHDFGPGFCIWMEEEDFAAFRETLQRAYDQLPGAFAGFSPRSETPRGSGRVGALSTRSFYARFIGTKQPPASLLEWLYLPEENLAAAVSGEVFREGEGAFLSIRRALSAYYPEDVRIKKIAARAAVMAQAGQYNYGRCMRRGETVAAQIALVTFLKAAMSMWYLLGKTYGPYYKWMYRGLTRLAASGQEGGAGSYGAQLAQVLPMLAQLSRLPDQQTAWKDENHPAFSPYENRLDEKVCLVETICSITVAQLQDQGLTDREETFLEAQTWEIMRRIQDPTLRGLHVMAG